MSLLESLQADIKTAMKAQKAGEVTALRTLMAQIKDATVNAAKEATDEAVATVVAKAIKQRQDALEQYRAASRADLATQEELEIALFRKYQPQQLDAAAITELVKAAIAATGATSRKDMGKVMGVLMPQVKGRADGKLVNQLVMAQLP